MKFFFLALFAAAPCAHATVFDAADVLPPNAGAISAMGEIILTDPTSEGFEAHVRYGLNDDWNIGAFAGTGDKEKNFRLGGQGLFNIFPDWEGQVGLSILGDAQFLRRDDTGGIQTHLGPILHKRITGWNGLPANLHLGLLWQLEGRASQFSSGTNVELGSDFDISTGNRYYMAAELGIRLARADSYVLFGLGLRLGDLTFKPREDRPGDQGKRRSGSGKTRPLPSEMKGGRDYNDDDFKK